MYSNSTSKTIFGLAKTKHESMQNSAIVFCFKILFSVLVLLSLGLTSQSHAQCNVLVHDAAPARDSVGVTIKYQWQPKTNQNLGSSNMSWCEADVRITDEHENLTDAIVVNVRVEFFDKALTKTPALGEDAIFYTLFALAI